MYSSRISYSKQNTVSHETNQIEPFAYGMSSDNYQCTALQNNLLECQINYKSGKHLCCSKKAGVKCKGKNRLVYMLAIQNKYTCVPLTKCFE